MRNPFHFFRKNQKALLAVFGVLLMIVFTIGGVVTSFFPQRAAFEAEDKTVVKIDGAPLTSPEIDRLRQDSSLVSLITGLAIARTQEVGGFPNPPSPPISGLRYQSASGPNSPGGPMREEISTRQVITDHLFSLEGERLGIAIGDDIVRDFMTSVTGGSITPDQYNELLAEAQGNEGRITYDQMFEMFRRVIQVQKTKRLLLEGISTATPASAWVNFRNLNRTIDVQLYPVNSSDYLSKVKQNPSDADLRKLFNKFNDQIRNPQTGDPGFLQLDKAAIGYVKADYDKFLQAELAKISDEQVAEYYEENKDSSFRKPVADPVAPMNQPAPEEKPTEEKPTEEAPADDKPAEEKPAAEEPKMEAPATEEKPAEPAPMTDKPAEEAPAEEKPAADEKPAEEKPADEESSFLSTGREAMLVAFQEETTEEKPAPEETPAEEKPADDKPAAEAPMTEAPATDAKPMEEAAAPMGETPAGEQPPVEYRPLEEVKEQIKTSIARPLAQASVKAALQNVADILKREYDDYFYLDEEDKTGTPFDKLDLKKLAQQNGLEYGEMPKMDYIAAMESPYGMISHAEFSFNPQQGGLQRNDLRLIDAIFGSKAELYSPQEFPGTSSTSMFSMPADQQFVYWKTDEAEGYVPTFDDVKDQVVAAWKEQQAAKLAKAEAEKIAAGAKGDAPLNEVVPAKDGVIVADNITYYQEIRQPGQYLLAEIPGVEKTGIEALDTIFAAPVGETFVVPNADKSVWYVARVTGERKTEAEIRDQLKAEMNGEYPFSVVYLEGMKSQIRWSEVQEELFERFNVEWQMIPEN
ncbi:hypothetical protein [Blastopirellula retiformator]|uniref:Periplasmic folding chaperone n=1 Tax=Blastopirellula retiformator TaxID=2527970 RepID=A0A5C5UUB6_9BACT|nr:hypothetical protein [Blastopirellula retiformator]TWT29688.1 periplasmic folding chaperone [Blastopirellula retiformator]